MNHFRYRVLEDGTLQIPALNANIQDQTEGGDNVRYAYEVIAQQFGHNQFLLEEFEEETQ